MSKRDNSIKKKDVVPITNKDGLYVIPNHYLHIKSTDDVDTVLLGDIESMAMIAWELEKKVRDAYKGGIGMSSYLDEL